MFTFLRSLNAGLLTFVLASQIAASDIMLRPPFDPLEGVPEVPAPLRADGSVHLFIVQFDAHSREDYRQAIRDLGGTVYGFVPKNALIVKMDESIRQQVESLSFVRWAGPYHPYYRLPESLRGNLDPDEPQRYNITVFESGPDQKGAVATRIDAVGGTVDAMHEPGFLLHATLTSGQVLALIRWDEVAFVERWSPPTNFMNIAREISGAKYLSSKTQGYDNEGRGVRGEMADLGDPFLGNPAFSLVPIVPHHARGVVVDHATRVFGILFNSGVGTPEPGTGAWGLLHATPRAIYADQGQIAPGGPISRYTHTCELVGAGGICQDSCEQDFLCPYDAVFQSNSWGTVPVTDYSPTSAELDDIAFQYDIIMCQAQGNCGNPPANQSQCDVDPRESPAQAWAKNIPSVGGVYHFNTLFKTDDVWSAGPTQWRASIGPASDGRVKPDLTHFFDSILTTSGSRWTLSFGGTSGSTPITCGYFGLFFQIWADGLFGNTLVDPNCNPIADPCAFINRPHMTTAKAIMINTASQYIISPATDFTRINQGWGMIDVGRTYLLRDSFPVIIDETEVMDTVGQEVIRNVAVPADTRGLRATLVYADPMGDPAFQDRHAVNDLTLKVTAPDGTTHYWGNCGLREGNWSSSSCTQGDHPFTGDPTTEVIDTVENVFVLSPIQGTWTVRVIADEINEDGHLETAGVDDVDFALVVSLDPDCNQNGVSDLDEILQEIANDCNENEIPDDCDPDCDGDGVPDDCDPDCCIDADCTGGDLCCDFVCSDCCTDDDCGTGLVCCDNVCTVGECCISNDCGSGQLCCNYNCETWECCDDSDCTHPWEFFCRTLDHTCVSCLSDADCGANGCCTVSGTCSTFACAEF